MIKLYEHRGQRVDALSTVTHHKTIASLKNHVIEFCVTNKIKAIDVDIDKLCIEDSDYTHEVCIRHTKLAVSVYGFAHIDDKDNN